MLLDQVSREYQQTPGQTTSDSKGSANVEALLRIALDRLLESTTELHDYIQAEGSDRSYFSLAPVPSFRRLSEVVRESLFFLGQCIISFPVRSNRAFSPRSLLILTEERLTES